jgi:hypothetical protein
MATAPQVKRPKAAKAPRARKGPDPTGRVDLLAIGLLERAVQIYGDVPLRGIYGTHKKQIDQAIRRYLGGVRIYMGRAPQLGAGGGGRVR